MSHIKRTEEREFQVSFICLFVCFVSALLYFGTRARALAGSAAAGSLLRIASTLYENPQSELLLRACACIIYARSTNLKKYIYPLAQTTHCPHYLGCFIAQLLL
jgi:hypothetical protein